MSNFEQCKRELTRADDQLAADSFVPHAGLQLRAISAPPLAVGQGVEFGYPASDISPCSEAFNETGYESPHHADRDKLAEIVAEATGAALYQRLSGGSSRADLGAFAKAFMAVLKTAGIGDAAKKTLHALVSELPKLRGQAFANRVETIHGVASKELKASEPELFRAYGKLRAEALKHK